MATARPPAGAQERMVRYLRHVAIAAAAVVIWLSWIDWPHAAAPGLDASWQLVLGYAHAERWQFGTDVVITHGPWSFLNVFHCYRPAFWPTVAWQLFFKALVACAVAYSATTLPVWRAILLVSATVLLLPLFEDVAPVLLVLFILWRIVQSEQLSLVLILSSAALFGFLALQKFSYFINVALAAGGTVAILVLRRQYREAMTFGLAVAASVCLFWIAAGQQLTGLPPFILRNWQLTSAYSEAMFINEPPKVFWCGIATVIAAAVALVVAIRRQRIWPPATRIAVLGIGLGFEFLIWKAGFVRADGHVQGFFLCALAAGLIFRPTTTGYAVAATALIGFVVSSQEIFVHAPALLRLRVATSLRALASPVELRVRFEADTARAVAAARLPQVRERVGEQTIDVFSDDQAVAVLNGLSYHPRPIFLTHQVYSSALAELNARCYAAPKAPQYVLMRLQTIDDRFLPEDDARCLMMLLQSYQPVLEENGWRLLERQPERGREASIPIASKHVWLGATICVPQRPESLVSAAIDLQPTMLGRARTFFYKSAEVRLMVNDGDAARAYRLIVPAARGGFLIAPLLRDANEYRELVDRGERHNAQTLIIEVAPGLRKFYKGKVSVEFSESRLNSPSE